MSGGGTEQFHIDIVIIGAGIAGLVIIRLDSADQYNKA
jgi:cation diffusion facilitator CzcD-associated flavoprotein CzcO